MTSVPFFSQFIRIMTKTKHAPETSCLPRWLLNQNAFSLTSWNGSLDPDKGDAMDDSKGTNKTGASFDSTDRRR